jgi:signal-transduction protein with cAMP-binding, CBS, and nucleotidyltransferase domain
MKSTNDTVRVDEIMTENVISVSPDTPVDEIARLLSEHQISAVPVLGTNQEPVGIVSELDVISRTGATAGDIMSTGVISVTEETPAVEVVDILRSRRVRRVPVVRDGQIIGVVSRSDLVRLFSLTRWTCADCGYFVRGFQRPERCSDCGSTSITLEREPPGM